jgi:cell pole-organizing protein PopZ
MTQPAKANEPSMEEILASIRRIIADDDVSKSAQAAPEAAPPAAPVAPAARPAVLPPRLPAAPQPVSSPEASQLEAASAAAATDDGVVDEQSADILELTESMATPAAPAPQFRTIEGNLDVGFDEQPEKPAPQAAVEAHPQLISRATGAAVDSAFNTLAQTVLVHNARTLEDLVREMLRPLLKAWLDENLPGVVERLVRAEIERVSRGR